MRRGHRLLLLVASVAGIAMFFLAVDTGTQGSRQDQKEFTNSQGQGFLADLDFRSIRTASTNSYANERANNKNEVLVSRNYANHQIVNENILKQHALEGSSPKTLILHDINNEADIYDLELISPKTLNSDQRNLDHNHVSTPYEGLPAPNPIPEPPLENQDQSPLQKSQTHSTSSPAVSEEPQILDTLPRSTRRSRDIDRFDRPIEIARRPENVSRLESPFYPWGSHEFGPLIAHRFAPYGTRWNAYFYEQTVAVVLEDAKRNILNCTLLEIM